MLVGMVGGRRVERPGEMDSSRVNGMGCLISNNMDFERVFGARIEGGTHTVDPLFSGTKP